MSIKLTDLELVAKILPACTIELDEVHFRELEQRHRPVTAYGLPAFCSPTYGMRFHDITFKVKDPAKGIKGWGASS